jgi:3-oxoacyl-[acyl-carrier protein] reductase
MESNSDLAGQVALVSGGGRGIGAAIARRLAQMGALVVICGRSQPPLDHVAAQIRSTGGQCEPLRCDVTNLGQVEALARRLLDTFGRIDVLVNNAGIGGPDLPLHELPPHDFDTIFATNLRGVFYCMRAFVPAMISASRGHIVNISSIAGRNPLPRGAAYAASKWGLNGMSYSAAEELRRYNIRVSLVSPGSVHSDFSPHAGKDPAKMLQPEDVANVVAMLVTQAPQAFCSDVVIRPTQKP